MFDTNPKLIGLKIREIEILDIDYLSSYLEKKQYRYRYNMCTP